ncbi:MAG: hypothetical protein E7628_00480 [Ruminococcaceae bacterium]|nr:hypothetical protein [Oscillospiraceae bacterium]
MNKLVKTAANSLLKGINPVVYFEDGSTQRIPVSFFDDGKTVSWFGKSKDAEVVLKAEYTEESAVFYIDVKSTRPLGDKPVIVPAETDFADNALIYHHCGGPCWMYCTWDIQIKNHGEKSENMLLRLGDDHYAVTTLVGTQHRSAIDKDGLFCYVGTKGSTCFFGPVMAVTVASDPLKSMEINYRHAREVGAIRVPLRDGREYPEMFEDFGWCSWNAFYQQPTSEKIYAKLDELKDKNIPVKWIIIDDGWSPVEGNKLKAFEEDREKFPEGLKECIRRIKEDYGIEKVGVWHTIHAYWQGIHPDSELNKSHADSLVFSPEWGRIVPVNDLDKQYKFWDDWHSYLSDCGVDFVKVDNQGGCGYLYIGICPVMEGVWINHEAIERSINKHFGGTVINCMGMDLENVQTRPYTAMNRNSDDFYPDRENGFEMHLRQNIYNAIWHSQVMHCDYDMWWSGKSDPVQSGLLRAISGGPIYISDATGDTNRDNIIPVVGENGDICRLDHYAMPTYDCIYIDCKKDRKLVKTFNSKGDAVAVALFNICNEDISETFKWNVVPDIKADTEYVAYEYFTKKYTRITADSEEAVTLGAGDVRAYSIYPIIDGEYINFGDSSRYIGIGARETKKVLLSEIL